MARGINKVILVGTTGKDPEVRYSQSGTANATLSLATNETWKDKNGEKQERTEWHRLKFFGKLAEIVGEYVTKGQTIYVEGSLRTDKYTDKQGIERYTTDIIVSEMQMLGGKGGGEGGEGGERAARQPASRAPAAEGRATRGDGFSNMPPRDQAQAKDPNTDPFDDDVPF